MNMVEALMGATWIKPRRMIPILVIITNFHGSRDGMRTLLHKGLPNGMGAYSLTVPWCSVRARRGGRPAGVACLAGEGDHHQKAKEFGHSVSGPLRHRRQSGDIRCR